MNTLVALLGLFFLGCSAQAVGTVSYVAYTDNGFQLAGYLALPSGTGPFPAVIVVPDWDGVNQYEVKRARMLAGAGYVSFAADIYGADKRFVSNITERGALAGLYRGNATLFVQRIKAAVDLIRARSDVISSKVALFGYCFGGTGVINYALSGANVSGIISFHGGLTQRLAASASTPILAKMLLYSGGSDDPSTEVMKLEGELNQTAAVWEITRFSQIQHAFTIWSDARYNARADSRSWEGALRFLTEIFYPTDSSVQPTNPLSLNSPPNFTAVQYAHEGTALEGYEVVPNNGNNKIPAIVILPDWDGVNNYEQQRARLAATLTSPYVTFAADIYGANLHEVANITERISLVTLYRGNITLYNGRIKAAVDTVKSRSRVDPAKVVVIGYCFGGTGVFNYAISGARDVLGVVSFHGGLSQRLSANSSVPIPASVLVHSGGADDTASSIEQLEKELNASNATWEISRYSKVVHGFTDWSAGSAYSARADMRSWYSLVSYLAVTFNGGVYQAAAQPADIVLPTEVMGTSTTGAGMMTSGTAAIGTAAICVIFQLVFFAVFFSI